MEKEFYVIVHKGSSFSKGLSGWAELIRKVN